MGTLLDLALSVAPGKEPGARSRDHGAVLSSNEALELEMLVHQVASFHGFDAKDRDEALAMALTDIPAALTCFRALVKSIPHRADS